MPKYNVKPLTSDRWEDLLKLFGKSGAYWNCWCMYWRYSNKEYNEASREQKVIELKNIVHEKPHTPGLLAYKNDNPIGWIGFSPKSSFERLNRSRVIKSTDNLPAWSIVCFFVHKNFREKGVASSLIRGSIEYARANNINIIESYPVDNRGHRLDDISSYYGTMSMFEKAGFDMISETKSTSNNFPRVIMRYFNK